MMDKTRRKVSVLVIDDNEDLCEFIHDALTITDQVECEYITTPSKIREIRCDRDIVFLDLCIPDFDGFELMEMLHSTGCTTNLVLMSGNSKEILNCAKVMAESYGFNVLHVLEKPFRIDEVIDTVGRAVDELAVVDNSYQQAS